MNYQSIILDVAALSKEVGAYLRNEQLKIKTIDVEKKGQSDFVTYVDKTAERKIVDHLKTLLPEAGFIAEEKSEARIDKDLMWIIDPLDGTTNYIHGLSPFAISIGLMERGQMVGGVVYEVSLDECFYAWKDGSAYLNGQTISVSKAPTIKDSLLATGFPYYDFTRLEQFIHSLSFFLQNSHGVRRLGSAATDLIYVACGRLEGVYEYGLSPWDVAAGAFIVQQAGGKVSDYSGGNNYIFGREVIATNALIHKEFQEAVDRFMSDRPRN